MFPHFFFVRCNNRQLTGNSFNSSRSTRDKKIPSEHEKNNVRNLSLSFTLSRLVIYYFIRKIIVPTSSRDSSLTFVNRVIETLPDAIIFQIIFQVILRFVLSRMFHSFSVGICRRNLFIFQWSRNPLISY